MVDCAERTSAFGESRAEAMHDAPYRVLFLCTGNSARSILAECLLNRLGAGRFQAFSAGSHPRARVHPRTLQVLSEHGHPTAGLRSKSWDEFATPGAPRFDLVVTVCDDVAGEACPVWLGSALTAHWGLPDPAAVTGPREAQRQAFEVAYDALEQRLARFVRLDLPALGPTEQRAALRALTPDPPSSRPEG